MTEDSFYWAGIATGDAGPYTDDEFSDIWRKLFLSDRTLQGVLSNYLNELAVSGVVTPVSVATGAALVDGKYYENDAITTVAIPTPAGSTRIDRIVLRKDFSAQTVRITRVAGSEGGGAPAITQVDGTTWDILLAQASITTGGAITVTDERDYVSSAIGVHKNSILYTTEASVPPGYSEYTSARGRLVVGLPSGGTAEGTVGTALTDQQDKTHTHTYTTNISHSHTVDKGTGAGGQLRVSYGTSAADGTIPTSTDGSASGTTATSALSDFLAYIQLLAIIKD